jgi:4-diphosphocytidyl-2-C-methyl-D-erythritol kinase
VAEPLVLDAPAKLNLSLAVGPPREDGYHPVASLMVALDAPSDTVEVRPAARRSLDAPGSPAGAANLAWRALDALEAAAGRPLPVAVRIVKRIPMQAGLGGGSSDAAAVLVGAARLHGLGLGADALERIAAALGSDVPFFIRGGTQWATGRGELVAPRPLPERLWVVVHPPVTGLATARVYAALDRLPAPPPLPAGPPETPWRGAAWVRNDLWPAALACAPALGRAARRLAALGASRVLLCGSGGALAGLFDDEGAAREAVARADVALLMARPAPPRRAEFAA